jgi:hypothetical protein
MRSFGGPKIRPEWDLSKPGLGEAWDAGDRSSVFHDEDLDLMTA